VVNSLHREAESALATVTEALERQITGIDSLRLAAHLVLDDLGVEAADEPGQLAAQLVQGVDVAVQGDEITRQEARSALFIGVQRAFAVTRSHYANIALDELSQGYPADYTDAELDAIEEEVAPFARALTDKMQEENEGNQ